MEWVPSLDQLYCTNKKILVTSGASFTASTTQLNCAASWPGYVYDRCRFNRVVDLSYPGVGNEYIADSIVNYINQLDSLEYQNHLVVIMWSGLGWATDKISNSTYTPCINNVSYQRKNNGIPSREDHQQDTELSYQRIIAISQFLKEKNISYVFTYYANILFPPCLPRNDLTCNFADYLSHQEIIKLQQLPWVPPNKRDYLYDYAFFNDYNVEYHPPVECNLKWTDNILLPSICEQGFITKL